MGKRKPKHRKNAPAGSPAEKNHRQRDDRKSMVWQKAVGLLLVVLLPVLLFFPVGNFDFVNWDDDQYVTENQAIRDISGRQISGIFSNLTIGDYVPLTILSYALEYHFFKLDPSAYHWNNLILHLLNVLLILRLTFVLSGQWWMAVFCGILFGIHPLHVESVCWISERKGLLYTFFFLGSLLSYLAYRERKGSLGSYAASLLLFAAALLSKGVAVTLPLILLLIDYLRKEPFTQKLLWEKLPFFLLSGVFGIIAIYGQGSAGATQQTAVWNFGERIFIAGYTFMSYLFKALIPYPISGFYPYPANELPFYFYLMPVLAAMLLYGLYYLRKKQTALVFGLLFFTVTIAPLVQLIPVGDAIMTDRFTYLPYWGLFWVMALGGNRGSGKMPLLLTGSIIYLLILAFTSSRQVKVWENGNTFWTAVIEKYPDVWVANNNRGNWHLDQGNDELALKDYRNAIKANPGNPDTYNNLGNILFRHDRFEEALKAFEQALAIDPGHQPALRSRAILWADQGQHTRAVEALEKIVQAHPDDVKAYNSLGNIQFDLQQYEQAIQTYDRAIAISPLEKKLYLNRSAALAAVQRTEAAIGDLEKVIRIDPADAQGYLRLGVLLFNAGKTSEAIPYYDQAIAIDPGYAEAYYNRSGAYFTAKHYGKAAADAQKARFLGYPVPQGFLKAIKNGMP